MEIAQVRILAGYRGDAAGYYRTRAPLSVVAKRYGAQVLVGPVSADSAGEYDVVWLQQVADPVSEIAVRDHKRAGARIVYDCDDFLQEIPPTWQGYDDWFHVRSGLRKDRLEFHRRIMRLADVVTCPTQALAQALAESKFLGIGPETIRVLPNCVMGGQWDVLGPLKRSPEMEGRLVVGWFGTSNHWDDLIEIVNPVHDAIEALDAALVIVGFPGIVTALPQALRDRTYIQDLVSIKNFDKVQQAMVTFDVGLAWCTRRLKANRLRSPLKVIQYGAARVPVVASVAVYGDLPGWDPRDRETRRFDWGSLDKQHENWRAACAGFPAKGVYIGRYGMQVEKPEGVAAAIVALSNRLDVARKMAQDWQARVWEHHTYEMQVDRWRDVILEAVNGPGRND